MEENSARKEGEGAKDPNALGVNTRWRYCRAAHATIAP